MKKPIKKRHMIGLDEETYNIIKTIAEKNGCWQVTVMKKAIILYKNMVEK